MFDFAQLKHDARRAIHDTMRVTCDYTATGIPSGTQLGVRWHNKINRMGDLENQGYAEIVEGIDRMIFDLEELSAKGITLVRNGVVTLPEIMGSISFALDVQEPDTGPIERIWLVTRES